MTTPIEAAAQRHEAFHGDDGFDGQDRARDQAREIVEAFLDAAAQDALLCSKVKDAAFFGERDGLWFLSGKDAILALKGAL